ncbi:MAG: sulfite exporter TauE/SafE family protein [Chthoniobacterales bacterium]|nr:sulfite exporter TauE/SafE family protein [Chthoniobacterales bacterium]
MFGVIPLELSTLIPLLLGIALVAFLYSSVGHAGASGYIAVLSLCGFSASFIRPTALVLNILVATIGTFQFWRAGHFSWRLFWPFALLSVPFAYLGGSLAVPADLLKMLIGVVLLFSAARLFFRHGDPAETTTPPRPAAIGAGAAIGFLSGLTGTGGGIFLTPLLLFCRWSKIKPAAAVSVLFILLNSIAGLTGYLASGQAVPSSAWLLAVAAVLAGGAGSYLGSQRFPARTISLLLAAVLSIAGCKLLFT